MKLKVPTKIEIKDSEKHGLGVFAIERIEKDEIIEECHFAPLPVCKNGPEILINYRFKWRDDDDLSEEDVAVFGYGSIYNHNYENNARYLQHPEYRAFQFIAIRQIEVGEEICTDYGSEVLMGGANALLGWGKNNLDKLTEFNDYMRNQIDR